MSNNQKHRYSLEQLTEHYGISQRQLAKKSGYSPSVINQLIKHGNYPSSINQDKFVEQINQALIDLGVHPNDANQWHTQTQSIQTKELPDMQSLTQAAKQLFKLPKSPFTDDVQSRDDVYLSDEQRYIRQTMLSTAKHAGFIAIVGESGRAKPP